MTKEQRQQLDELRRAGVSHKDIARQLDISDGTVRSYCHRHPLGEKPKGDGEGRCKQCGGKLSITPKQKPKKFCSDKCRNRWWKDHSELINRKAYTQHTCRWCGQRFESYAAPNRIYCSRSCYADARRKEMS